jgi:hypothetical protein
MLGGNYKNMKFKAKKNRRMTDKEKISCGYKKTGEAPEEVRPWRGKRKWPCKKLKGEHDFIFQEEKTSSFLPDKIEIYECSACKKKKWKFIKNRSVL